jgi:hypothetical protein
MGYFEREWTNRVKSPVLPHSARQLTPEGECCIATHMFSNCLFEPRNPLKGR